VRGSPAAEHNRLGTPPKYLYYQQDETLEQFVRNQQVGGSIPLAGSIDSPHMIGRFKPASVFNKTKLDT
jgi:hypothetical protein